MIPDGMGMTDQMEWECHIIPVWYGNVIPDGMAVLTTLFLQAARLVHWTPSFVDRFLRIFLMF